MLFRFFCAAWEMAGGLPEEMRFEPGLEQGQAEHSRQEEQKGKGRGGRWPSFPILPQY